jgi:hypothetical protein
MSAGLEKTTEGGGEVMPLTSEVILERSNDIPLRRNLFVIITSVDPARKFDAVEL